jgi:hypothetical protein
MFLLLFEFFYQQKKRTTSNFTHFLADRYINKIEIKKKNDGIMKKKIFFFLFDFEPNHFQNGYFKVVGTSQRLVLKSVTRVCSSFDQTGADREAIFATASDRYFGAICSDEHLLVGERFCLLHLFGSDPSEDLLLRREFEQKGFAVSKIDCFLLALDPMTRTERAKNLQFRFFFK